MLRGLLKHSFVFYKRKIKKIMQKESVHLTKRTLWVFAIRSVISVKLGLEGRRILLNPSPRLRISDSLVVR